MLQCETCGKYTDRLIEHGCNMCLDCYLETIEAEARDTFNEDSFDRFDDEEDC